MKVKMIFEEITIRSDTKTLSKILHTFTEIIDAATKEKQRQISCIHFPFMLPTS